MSYLAGVKVGGETSKPKQATSAHYYSISRPKRFELDAFDLEASGDEEEDIRRHVMPREEIMLAGTSKEGVAYMYNKCHHHEESSLEAYSSIHTPTRDVFSPHSMDIDTDLTTLSHATSNLEESGMDKFRGIKFSFSLEDHLEPMIFGEADKDSGFFMPSVEADDFTAEQIPDLDAGKKSAELPILLDDEMQSGNHEPEKQPGSDTPFVVGLTSLVDLVDKEKITEKHLGPIPVIEGTPEPESFCETGKESHTLHLPSDVESAGRSSRKPEMDRLLDEELNVELNKMTRVSEMSPLPDQIAAKHHSISMTVDVTPPVSNSRDHMAVPTPSIKECSRVKKRKCLFDEAVVLPNNVIKHWIGYSGDLVCKRRKAPVTNFHTWQARKISNLPRSFLEPLIPCECVMLKSPVAEKNFKTREPVEPVAVRLTKVIKQTPSDEIMVEESPIMEKSRVQTSELNTETPLDEITVEESPIKEKSREQTPIAPATPVTQPASLRSHEARVFFRPDTPERPSRSESVETEIAAPDEGPDLITGLMDDEEINSSAGVAHGKQKLSLRTRKVAKYLHAKLQHEKKQTGGTFLNLTHVLHGKTRKESARLFYEILVLKTGDSIDVRQEHSFGDILVKESSKLKNCH
ncbi:OLC1v1011792C1 [Oldenlandia corymbosa var. corymbosa]|nr:OLC1v1011792C1 [Oldenlandia corymbosa var. corymbosa]